MPEWNQQLSSRKVTTLRAKCEGLPETPFSVLLPDFAAAALGMISCDTRSAGYASSEQTASISGPLPGPPIRQRKEGIGLRVHLINPSDTAFGTAVITPRWLFVLAAATPEE